MVLTRYIGSRFLQYFLLTNIVFTLIFNSIECFEKLTRAQGTTTAITLSFIKYNVIPSFFDNFALAAWLATVFLIRELDLYHEWEGFLIVGIKRRSLIKIMCLISIILGIGSYIGKEKLFFNLLQRAESIRTTTKNKNHTTNLKDQWFAPNENRLCHINSLNYITNQGIGLTLIITNKKGTKQNILFASNFTFLPTQKKVYCNHATLITHKGIKTIVTNILIAAPFLSTDMTELQPQLINTLFENKQSNEIWCKNTNRLFSHLNSFVYPLLTLIIFFIMPLTTHNWMITLAVYPLLFGLTTIMQWFVHQQFPRYLMFSPYGIILFFLCITLYFNFKKRIISNASYKINSTFS